MFTKLYKTLFSCILCTTFAVFNAYPGEIIGGLTPIEYWYVCFDESNCPTNTSASQTTLCQQVIQGSSTVLPGSSCNGYLFQHWKDSSGTTYLEGNSFTPTSNIRLYAEYTSRCYPFLLDPNGGTNSVPNYLYKSTNTNALTKWYNNSSCSKTNQQTAQPGIVNALTSNPVPPTNAPSGTSYSGYYNTAANGSGTNISLNTTGLDTAWPTNDQNWIWPGVNNAPYIPTTTLYAQYKCKISYTSGGCINTASYTKDFNYLHQTPNGQPHTNFLPFDSVFNEQPSNLRSFMGWCAGHTSTFYAVGATIPQCGTTVNAICCSGLPDHAHWVQPNNPSSCSDACNWECDTGYTPSSDGGTCVPATTYTVSYNCGIGTGTPPQSHTALSIGNTFVARANTSNNCVVPVGYEFVGWQYSGDYNVYTSGSTITFNSPSNQTMTALYDRCAISISWNSGVINSGESYGTNGNGTIDFAWIFSRNTTYQNMNSSFFLPANTTVNNSNNSFTTYQSLCSGLDCTFYGGNTTNGTGLIMPAYTWRAPGYAPIAWLCTGTSSGDNYFIWQPGDNATIMYYDSTNQVCNNYVGKSMCAPLWTPLCATGNYTQSSTGVFYSATNHSYVRPYLNIARGGPYPYTTPISTNHSVAYETSCESGYTISSGANTACPVCVKISCRAGQYLDPNTNNCETCPHNYYSDANESECHACDIEKGYTIYSNDYRDHAGSQSCKTTCSCGTAVLTANPQGGFNGCRNVGENYYAKNPHTVKYGGISLSPDMVACGNDDNGNPLHTIGYGAGADNQDDCGKLLHTDDGNNHYKYPLRSCNYKLLSASDVDVNSNPAKWLHMKSNGLEWCADLTTVPNDHLRLTLRDTTNTPTTYYLYKDICKWPWDVSANTKYKDLCVLNSPLFQYNSASPRLPWAQYSSSWITPMPYGTMFGMSACIDIPSDINVYDVVEKWDTVHADEIHVKDACICKLVNPAFSMWVRPSWNTIHNNDYDKCLKYSECRIACPTLCALSMGYDPNFRNAMFHTVEYAYNNGTSSYTPVSTDAWRDHYNDPLGSTWLHFYGSLL